MYSKCRIDLLYCHAELVRRFSQSKDIWSLDTSADQDEELRLESQKIRCSSSVRSYRVVANLVTAPWTEPTIIRELQLWRVAFLWSIATLLYPSVTIPDADPRNFDGTDEKLQVFKDLVAEGGLDASTILSLFELMSTSDVEESTPVRGRGWLLVLLTELVGRGLVPVTSSLLNKIGTLLKNTDREIQQSQSCAPPTARDNEPPSTRLRVVGALMVESFSTSRSLREMALRSPSELIRVTARYVDALCEEDPRYIDVLIPDQLRKEEIDKTKSGDRIRLKINHAATFQFVEHLAVTCPAEVDGSGLDGPTQMLISLLGPSADDTLRESAERARNALAATRGSTVYGAFLQSILETEGVPIVGQSKEGLGDPSDPLSGDVVKMPNPSANYPREEEYETLQATDSVQPRPLAVSSPPIPQRTEDSREPAGAQGNHTTAVAPTSAKMLPSNDHDTAASIVGSQHAADPEVGERASSMSDSAK